MNRPNDSYDSAVMRVLVQPLLDEDLARFDEYNKKPHECSQDFNKKLNKLFNREKLSLYGRVSLIWMKRVAICAMVAGMLLLASCAAIKPLREKIVNAVVEWYSEYVAVYFVSETVEPIMRRITYIPEKYVVVQESILEDCSFVRYADDIGNLITFTCEPSNEAAVYYDNERHNIENVKVNGIDGLYFEGNSDISFLTWEEEGYTYSISGCFEQNELIKIAESLK